MTAVRFGIYIVYCCSNVKCVFHTKNNFWRLIKVWFSRCRILGLAHRFPSYNRACVSFPLLGGLCCIVLLVNERRMFVYFRILTTHPYAMHLFQRMLEVLFLNEVFFLL